jgi:uncharacterized membrane protein YfcA
MMDANPLVWAAIGGFVFVAFTLEAITGFGSTVIALALGALLVPIDTLVPVLVPLSLFLSGFMAWRYRRLIDGSLLVRTVLPIMLLGTLVGYGLMPLLDGTLMKRLFGLIIIWFSAGELWRGYQNNASRRRPVWVLRLLIFLAGVSHGLFASGGPLLVYSMAGLPMDKLRFRATLAAVWLLLNALLTGIYLLDGQLVPALPRVASYLPLLLLGLWLGEKLHHRVDEQQFRKAIFVLLLLTGSLLLLA